MIQREPKKYLDFRFNCECGARVCLNQSDTFRICTNVFLDTVAYQMEFLFPKKIIMLNWLKYILFYSFSVFILANVLENVVTWVQVISKHYHNVIHVLTKHQIITWEDKNVWIRYWTPIFSEIEDANTSKLTVQLSQFQTLLDVLAQGCTSYKGLTVVKYAVLVVNRRTIKGAKSGS